MASFLQRLFGGKTTSAKADAPDYEADPIAVVTPTEDEATVARCNAAGDGATPSEFVRFREEAELGPGKRLWEVVTPAMRDWFTPTTHEPEPKAIMRLALMLRHQGRTLSDTDGLTFFILGNWAAGGGCSDRSFERLEELAGLMGKPIRVFFREGEDAEEYRVTTIEPSGNGVQMPEPLAAMVSAIEEHRDHPAYARFRMVAPPLALGDDVILLAAGGEALVYAFERGEERAYIVPDGDAFRVLGWGGVGAQRYGSPAPDLRTALDGL